VGAALLFLGALLFGATIFLVAQMYHVQAHSHTLVLWWVLGIAPLVYALKSVPMAVLMSVLAYVWLGLFVFQSADPDDFFERLPVLYLVSGLLSFEVGCLHYLVPELKVVARTYRLVGIQVAIISLLLLTFEWFAPPRFRFSPGFDIGIVAVGLQAMALGAVNLALNPSRSATWRIEEYLSLGLTGLALVFLAFPPTTNVSMIVFNLALAGVLLTILTIGYQREDARLVDIGIRALSVLILIRYCDWFWHLLPRSAFFLIGGLLLLVGGVVLERKRRELIAHFGA
jgi:uncharacterized membrane protein